MKKAVKIIGFFLGTLAVILIGISIFIKIYFNSEKLKGLILPYAEKAVGRKVSIEDIQINIFADLKISGVNIQDNPAFRSAPFVSADEFILKYALWPLLKKELIINKVVVVKPHIFIERNERGVFNFNDLLQKKDEKGKATGAEQKPPSPVSSAWALTIAQVELQDGKITLLDKTIKPSSLLFFKGISFTARDISLTAPFTVRLLAELPDSARLSLSGQVNPVSRDTDLQLKIEALDIKSFAPYYRQFVPLTQLSCQLNLQSQIKTTGADKVQAKGKINLNKLLVTPKGLGKITTGGQPLEFLFRLNAGRTQPLTYAGTGHLSDLQINYQPFSLLVPHIKGIFQIDQQKIHIPKLEVALLGSKTSLVGTFSNYLQKPDLNLELKAHVPDPSRIYQALFPALSPDLKKTLNKFKTQGSIEVTASMSGDPFSSLRYRGEALLRKMKVQYTPYPSLSPRLEGRITFNKKEIAVQNLHTSLSRSDLTLNGKILDYLKAPAIYMDVSSKHLSLDKLLDAFQALTPPSSAPPSVPGKEKNRKSAQQGNIDLGGLSAEGKVYLANLVYKGLNLHDLKMTYALKDNTFRWQNLRTKVGADKGVIAMDGGLNLGKMAYFSKINLKSISVRKLLSALAPKFSSVFSGKIFADMDLSGEGISKEKIQDGLNLKGKFDLVEGKIQNTELGKSLFALLPIVNWSELKFKTVKGNVLVEKGEINLDSAMIKENYVLEPKGTIGLDSSLDLDLIVKISPRIPVGHKYMTDDQGWTVVPIKASGTLTDPVLKINFKEVEKGVEKKLEKRLQEKLQKELKQKLKKLFK